MRNIVERRDGGRRCGNGPDAACATYRRHAAPDRGAAACYSASSEAASAGAGPLGPEMVKSVELPDGQIPAANKDGNFIIGPTHKPAVEMAVTRSVPQGTVYEFTMESKDSKFYPGVERDTTAVPAGPPGQMGRSPPAILRRIRGMCRSMCPSSMCLGRRHPSSSVRTGNNASPRWIS